MLSLDRRLRRRPPVGTGWAIGVLGPVRWVLASAVASEWLTPVFISLQRFAPQIDPLLAQRAECPSRAPLSVAGSAPDPNRCALAAQPQPRRAGARLHSAE